MQKSGLAFNLLIFVQFSTLKNGGRASSALLFVIKYFNNSFTGF